MKDAFANLSLVSHLCVAFPFLSFLFFYLKTHNKGRKPLFAVAAEAGCSFRKATVSKDQVGSSFEFPVLGPAVGKKDTSHEAV